MAPFGKRHYQSTVFWPAGEQVLPAGEVADRCGFSHRLPRNPLEETRGILQDAPGIAFTQALVIDGTGAAPVADQTVIIREGRITQIGPDAEADIPKGAVRIALRQSVIGAIGGPRP